MFFTNIIFDRFVDVGFTEECILECINQTSASVGISSELVAQVIVLSKEFSEESLDKEYSFREFDLFKKVFKYRKEIKEMLQEFISANVSSCVQDYFWKTLWSTVENQDKSVRQLKKLRGIYLQSKPPNKNQRGFGKHKMLCASKTKNVSIVDIDNLQTLPYNDNTFDLIISFHELCYTENLPLAISEIHRILKPSGSFVVQDYDVESDSIAVFLDMKTTLCSTVFSIEKTPSQFRDTHKTFYRSRERTTQIITSHGFKFDKGQRESYLYCDRYVKI